MVNWCTRWGNLAGGALGQSSVGKLKRPVIPKVKTLMKMITNYKTSRKYYINLYVLMDIMIYNIYIPGFLKTGLLKNVSLSH